MNANAVSARTQQPREYPPLAKVRIGVVGGRFGCSFQWHEHPDCIVEAVSDLRPEGRKQLMKTYRCKKAYDSLGELVRDENIDAPPYLECDLQSHG